MGNIFIRLHEPRGNTIRRWMENVRFAIASGIGIDAGTVIVSTKKRILPSFILYLVHWARWLHVGSIIPVKRELTAIALGSRPRRFLTAKPFSWTAGVDSDILDSEIRCRNVRGSDSIFRRNVIRPFREKACEKCLDSKYPRARSHVH